MKQYDLLTVTSLIAIVLMSVHLSDDVTRGFEPGGLSNLGGIAILTVWLYATLMLAGRRWGYVIVLLGSLFTALMPAIHMRGKGVGGKIAMSDGGHFFIWTLYALGVVGSFATILTISAWWRSTRTRPAENA